jgi:plasmid stability protein
VKTTLDLPDDLMREIKVRAAREDRKLKDLVAELLRRGLRDESANPDRIRNRVKLPLIEGGHPAKPGEELTPERVAQILLDQEVDRALGR